MNCPPRVWPKDGLGQNIAEPALPGCRCCPLEGVAHHRCDAGVDYFSQPRLRKYSMGTTAESTIKPSANG
jgi:hypothetical protein